MNAHAGETYRLEHVQTITKQLRVILDAKNERSDLHKVMKNQCQHLTETQRNELIKLLQNLKGCLMEHLVLGKQTDLTSN